MSWQQYILLVLEEVFLRQKNQLLDLLQVTNVIKNVFLDKSNIDCYDTCYCSKCYSTSLCKKLQNDMDQINNLSNETYPWIKNIRLNVQNVCNEYVQKDTKQYFTIISTNCSQYYNTTNEFCDDVCVRCNVDIICNTTLDEINPILHEVINNSRINNLATGIVDFYHKINLYDTNESTNNDNIITTMVLTLGVYGFCFLV